MADITVLSRTQRIIVDSPARVRVVASGPPGSRGFKGDKGDPGEEGIQGEPGLVSRLEQTFTKADVVSVTTGRARWYPTTNGTVVAVFVALGLSPSTDDFVVDVIKNGSTIFPTSEKPTVLIGLNRGYSVPDDEDFLDGDYFTVDVLQADGVAADVVVTILYQPS